MLLSRRHPQYHMNKAGSAASSNIGNDGGPPPTPKIDFASPFPPAQSIILQGFPQKHLFYSEMALGPPPRTTPSPNSIPLISSSYVFDYPYMKARVLFTIDIPTITKLYLARIQRR